eukprot:3937425-Rhodomonas_salina.1
MLVVSHRGSHRVSFSVQSSSAKSCPIVYPPGSGKSRVRPRTRRSTCIGHTTREHRSLQNSCYVIGIGASYLCSPLPHPLGSDGTAAPRNQMHGTARLVQSVLGTRIVLIDFDGWRVKLAILGEEEEQTRER